MQERPQGILIGKNSCARPRTQRPLRVVRAVDRVVISGRMADVCAELDRLAAIEARTLH